MHLSVSQTFYNKVKLTLGVDNIFNYVPKTLGSGITMFNVPATPGNTRMGAVGNLCWTM